jgi:quercetin dioxygenase-like cupin family protein
MAGKHTYLKTHTLSAARLSFDLAAEETTLRERAATTRAGRAARALAKEGRLRVTLIVMTKGTMLKAHQVEGVISLHVLRGRARVSAEGGSSDLAPGGLLVLQEEVSHTVEARTDCSLLVTVAMTAGS